MYRAIIQPILFSLAPENAHDLMRVAGRVANVPTVSSFLQRRYRVEDPRLGVTVAGISFPNPVGLAAGLDKNAELVGLWSGLGFGHIELGTVTAKPQPGNPKPRIFRLADDQALINRMGFPSLGADAVREKLIALRIRFPELPPIGINIGKSKVTEVDNAIEDYSYSFSKLSSIVDYVTVNVSSPNTPGLRQLQERDKLTALLKALQGLNSERKPIFVKVSPDLSFSALEEVIDCCLSASISGVIATNTTIGREGISTPIEEAGGLSGAPLRHKSLEAVQFIGSRLQGRLALIGVGGISHSNDALAMLAAGASMVQVYTGLIYQGPGLAQAINRGLVAFMDHHRCTSLSEAAQAWNEGQYSRRASVSA